MDKQQETGHSTEEKFFGLTNEINTDDDPKTESNVVIEEDDEAEDTVEWEADDDTDDDGEEDVAAKDDDEEDGASDEEITEYSKNVQKRIDKLIWQRSEQERLAKQAQQERDEAIRAAQALNQRNQNYENIIQQGEAVLIQNIKEKADHALAAAKQTYKQAYEEGDTDAIIAAQEAFNRAQAEQVEALRKENDYQNRMRWQQQQWQQQQAQMQWEAQQRRSQPPQQQPPQQQQVVQPSERSLEWGKKNTWFHDPKHNNMTAVAYAAHATAVASGVALDSKEYYDFIDKEVRSVFPAYFKSGGQNQGKASPSQNTPYAVVASGQRNNGARPRKVRLKPSQIATAKAIGLTPEQYAEQILEEEMNRGR